MSHTYKSIELLVVGDMDSLVAEYAPKGARNARENSRMQRYITMEEKRECLAAHVRWLDDSVFVSVPHTDTAGVAIEPATYNALLVAAQADGVLVATQSGEKNGNYIRLSMRSFKRLARMWEGDRGPKFLQAVGLLFSTMTDGTATIVRAQVITPGHEYDRGQDGNGMMPKSMARMSMQIRAMVQGDPTKVVKGILSPTSPDGNVWIHHSQLKGTWNGETEVELLVLFNHGVSSERLSQKGSLRKRLSWLSSEVTALLENTHEVRREAALRVRNEVHALVALMQEDHRVEFLERHAGLMVDNDGSLEEARSAAIDILRTPIPMCTEIEALLGRFAIPEIVQIAHGAGIRTMVSLIVQDDRYGVKPLSQEEALKLRSEGKKVWTLYRVPTTGAQAVVFFAKNPYKKGIGYVVHSDAAGLMDGDSDGDVAFMILSQDHTDWIMHNLNMELSGTGKPQKNPKPDMPITPDAIIEFWMNMVANHPLVGRATTLGWRLIRDGRFDDARLALTAANAAPMLSKHNVDIHGESIANIVNRLAREERNRSPKDATGKAIIAPLNWREFKVYSKTLTLVRQFHGWESKVESVLDACVNGAAYIVGEWHEAHPVQGLTAARTARLVFAQNGTVLPGWAIRNAAQIRKVWGDYWMEHSREVNGERVFDAIDHSKIYNTIRELGSVAEVETLAALLTYQGQYGESMSLKFTAIFDTHRGVEVLGLHPDVQSALVAKNARIAERRAYAVAA